MGAFVINLQQKQLPQVRPVPIQAHSNTIWLCPKYQPTCLRVKKDRGVHRRLKGPYPGFQPKYDVAMCCSFRAHLVHIIGQ